MKRKCHKTSDNLGEMSGLTITFNLIYLPARRRPQGLVVIGVCLSVCLSVCLCALFLCARYLKNGFMDHHQIWWVGAGGEPLEQVQFWC